MNAVFWALSAQVPVQRSKKFFAARKQLRLPLPRHFCESDFEHARIHEIRRKQQQRKKKQK